MLKLLTAAEKIWDVLKNVRSKQRGTWVNNVLRKLNHPYDPHDSPKYGPIFSRNEWNRNLLKKVDTDCYICYYGSSGVGKSVAINQALKGRKGVVYLPLRKCNEETLPKLFMNSIGYFGGNREEDTSFVEAQETFIKAAKEYRNKYQHKIVVIADNLQDCVEQEKPILFPKAKELAKYFLDLYNSDHINCIYTVSDYVGYTNLRELSGHSTRLKSELFPNIPNDDFKNQLGQLVLKREETKHGKKLLFSFKERGPPLDDFVFKDDRDIDYLVHHLESHMGSITEVLRLIIEDKLNVREAVDNIIKDSVCEIASALIGENHGLVDYNTYILTAYALFESISNSPDGYVRWSTVFDVYPKLNKEQTKMAINLMVEKNLLEYINCHIVKFHRKSLEFAFSKHERKDPLYKKILPELYDDVIKSNKLNTSEKANS